MKRIISKILVLTLVLGMLATASVSASVRVTSVNNWTISDGIKYSSARDTISKTGAYDCYNSTSSTGVAICVGQSSASIYYGYVSRGIVTSASSGATSNTVRAYSEDTHSWRVALWADYGTLTAANATIRD